MRFRRFFYSFFNARTVAELVAIWAYPQDVVDYPRALLNIGLRYLKTRVNRQRFCATRIDFERRGVLLPYLGSRKPLQAILWPLAELLIPVSDSSVP